MSFSSPETSKEQSQGTQHGNFGQRVGQYLENRNPVAGALMHQIFGSENPQQQVATNIDHISQSMNDPALMQQSYEQPDFSGLAQGTQRLKTGGGLTTLLKLLGGGA